MSPGERPSNRLNAVQPSSLTSAPTTRPPSAPRRLPQLLARTVLAELAVRRGDDAAPELLADLAVQADRAGDLQRMTPVLELAAEWALTSGAPMPIDRIEALLAAIRERGIGRGWGAIRKLGQAAAAATYCRSSSRSTRGRRSTS